MFAFNMKMAAIDLPKQRSSVASKIKPDSSDLLWNFVGKNSDSEGPDDKSPSHTPSDTSTELLEDEQSASS